MTKKEEVKEVLERCRGLRRCLADVGMPNLEAHDKPLFISLLEAIVSQQLSVKAAQTIYGRFEALFHGGDINPHSLSQLTVDDLRSAGISRQKSGYLFAIADFFDFENWHTPEWIDEQEDLIVQRLTSIKGVGSWTAKMILMFNLGKEDVFPHEDLGVRLTMKELYGIEGKGKKLVAAMEQKAELWRPYRSHASRLLWRWKER